MPFTPSVEGSSHKKRGCSGRLRPSTWVDRGSGVPDTVGAFVVIPTISGFLWQEPAAQRRPFSVTAQLGLRVQTVPLPLVQFALATDGGIHEPSVISAFGQ